MSIEVLAVGDELLSGATIDTNSNWIARALFALGLQPARVTQVGDEPAALRAAFAAAWERCRVLIVTGGLGPTVDDRTKEVVAEYFGDPLVLDEAVLAELRARTATKPQPPTDWARDANIDCRCADCRELVAFLKNPNEQVHRFPRRKDLRQHLHGKIDHHQCDLTHVTVRVGSPQTLVCTKTQASYERRLAQFNVDTELLGELESLPVTEKLYEELFNIDEESRPTDHPLINRAVGAPESKEVWEKHLNDIQALVHQRDATGLIAKFREIIPNYSPGGASSVNP